MNQLVKTFLVTGGAGFIGSNFVHYLYDKYPDYRILVLDLLTYAGSLENLPGGFSHGANNGRLQFWYGDVRNASLVDSLVAQSDVVVHFAAETHVTRSIYDNYHFFETDVLGTQVVANSVLKHMKQHRPLHPHFDVGGVRHRARAEDGRGRAADADEPVREREGRRRPARLLVLRDLQPAGGHRAARSTSSGRASTSRR